jgi:hypothetical protein
LAAHSTRATHRASLEICSAAVRAGAATTTAAASRSAVARTARILRWTRIQLGAGILRGASVLLWASVLLGTRIPLTRLAGRSVASGREQQRAPGHPTKARVSHRSHRSHSCHVYAIVAPSSVRVVKRREQNARKRAQANRTQCLRALPPRLLKNAALEAR